MTIPRFVAICAHWQKVPPVAVSAARIAEALGVKVAPAPASSTAGLQDEKERAASRQALVDMIGGAGGGVNTEMPEWLRAAMT